MVLVKICLEDVLERICAVLDCEVGDILKIEK